mmetsp:Transcript_70885/g.117776  ORF Transcript_70885/g.117776 Transcript_70885/m.117776 type:complete len:237 (+) Transcript_70885:505-1215(+)
MRPRLGTVEHVMQDERKGVHIHLLGVIFVKRNFGGHVAVRARLTCHHAHTDADLAYANAVTFRQRPQLGETKVRDFQCVGEVEEQVGGLEVAVEDGRLTQMQVVHAPRELRCVTHRTGPRHGVALVKRLQQVLHRAAHQLGEHRFMSRLETHAEQHADVWVAKLPEYRTLCPQIAQCHLFLLITPFFLESLCCHRRAAIGALENVAKSARADLRDELDLIPHHLHCILLQSGSSSH